MNWKLQKIFFTRHTKNNEYIFPQRLQRELQIMETVPLIS